MGLAERCREIAGGRSKSRNARFDTLAGIDGHTSLGVR